MGYHQMGPVSGWVGRIFAGWAGVDIFFVLSGFLITSVLVQEQQSSGSFSKSRFYLRRCLRIWPAYYSFLLVMILWPNLHVQGTVFLGSLFLINVEAAYIGGDLAKPLLHLWSLCIEEQFYLVWPVALEVARERQGSLGKRANSSDTRRVLFDEILPRLYFFPSISGVRSDFCLL
jgi:peptidoglycan/LPS O-acetylase OafA/YrhL